MCEDRYRAVVTWRKLRPYYPDSHVDNVKAGFNKPYHNGYNDPDEQRRILDFYDADKRDVGKVEEWVYDNSGNYYKTERGARQAAYYHIKGFPYRNIYGDAKNSVEIISIEIQKAEFVLE